MQQVLPFPNMMPCWVMTNSTNEMFVRGVVKSQLDSNTYLVEVNGQAIQVNAINMYSTNTYNETLGFDDMNDMNLLNEAEIVFNLKHRYSQDCFATYIGSTLIVINPMRALKDPQELITFSNYVHLMQQPDFQLKSERPHPFGIAAQSISNLIKKGKNQSIIINGESGSGKTENTKIIMKFIAKISESDHNEKQLNIEDRILACNPILEAFGNAKTMANDNSSRFGRYITINIRQSTKRIRGAQIQNYMLENSRVVATSPKERNFHIFYQLLQGATSTTLDQLKLSSNFKNYNYLYTGQDIKTSQNDKANYQKTLQALQDFEFDSVELTTVLKVLASILQTGNLEFDASQLTDKNPCQIKSPKEFQAIAELLEIPEDVLRTTFTLKTRMIGKSSIESPLLYRDAISNRDSFASNLYDCLFNWLVTRLNSGIIGERSRSSSKISQNEIRNISLLDIFGFESLTVNSFEQFCVNYTFEKLQLIYIKQLFKTEETEFTIEDLLDHYKKIHYSDNSQIIDMMDKPPSSIFDLIDESSQLGSGSDAILYQKIVQTYKNNPCIEVPKIQRVKFTILHSAKKVEYSIENFRAKNKSEVSSDILNGIYQSKNQLLKNFFDRQSDRRKSQKFLGAKYRRQVKGLVDELNESDCHFIRCIRPSLENSVKFIGYDVYQQIKELGILQSVRVRQEGYPVRKEYKQQKKQRKRMFYEEFFIISSKYKDTYPSRLMRTFKEASKEILKEIVPTQYENIVFGRFKFYGNDLIGRVMDEISSKIFEKKVAMTRKIQRQFRVYYFVSLQEGLICQKCQKIIGSIQIDEKHFSQNVVSQAIEEVIKEGTKDRGYFKLKCKNSSQNECSQIFFDLEGIKNKKELEEISLRKFLIARMVCRLQTRLNMIIFKKIKQEGNSESQSKISSWVPSAFQFIDSSSDQNDISPINIMTRSQNLTPAKIIKSPEFSKSQDIEFNLLNFKSTNKDKILVDDIKKMTQSLKATASTDIQIEQEIISTQQTSLIPFLCDPLYFMHQIPDAVPDSIDKVSGRSIDKTIERIQQTNSFERYWSQNIGNKDVLLNEFKWDKRILKQSLLPLDKNLMIEWDQAMRYIYTYGGDMVTEKRLQPHKILQSLVKLIQNKQELIDSIYLILVKQIMSAPALQQQMYTNILMVVSSCVLPKQKLLFAIVNILSSAAMNTDSTSTQIKSTLKFIQRRLINTLSKTRTSPPSLTEIEYLLECKQIMIPLAIYNTNKDYLFIEPNFTERDLIRIFCEKYNLEDLVEFLGITLSIEGKEIFLDERTLIVDALYQQEELEMKVSNHYKQSVENYFSIKIKIFFLHDNSNPNIMALSYITHVYQFIHQPENKLADILSQLKYQADVPSRLPIQTDLQNYVPSGSKIYDSWFDLRLQAQRFSQLSRNEARLEFLEKFKLQNGDASWQFEGTSLSTNVIFQIQPFKLFIKDLRGVILFEHDLSKIVVWNLMNNALKIEYVKGQQIQILFKDNYSAQSCQELMKSYVKKAFMN